MTENMRNEDIAERVCVNVLTQFKLNTLENEKEEEPVPTVRHPLVTSKTEPAIPKIESRLHFLGRDRSATIAKECELEIEVPDESGNTLKESERNVKMDTIAMRPRTEVIISLEKKLVSKLNAGCFRRENIRAMEEKYEVLNVIGKGAHGEVKMIKDRNTGDVLAAKIIPKAVDQMIHNFEEEIKILQKLVFLYIALRIILMF